MTITSPTGRSYEWNKPTPPTEEDMAALIKYDDSQNAAESGTVVGMMGRGIKTPAEMVARSESAMRGGAAALADTNLSDLVGQAKSMTINTAAPIVGQMAGSPFGSAGRVVGRGVGAAVGSVADQLTRDGKVKMGEVVQAMMNNAAPNAGMVGNTLVNTGAKAAESVIDGRGLPSVNDLRETAGASIVGSGLSKMGRAPGAVIPKTPEEMTNLERARKGNAMGFAIAPTEGDRGVAAVVKTAIAGPTNLKNAISEQNSPRIGKVIRGDLEGFGENTQFTRENFDGYRKSLSGPYAELGGLGGLNAPRSTGMDMDLPSNVELNTAIPLPGGKTIKVADGAELLSKWQEARYKVADIRGSQPYATKYSDLKAAIADADAIEAATDAIAAASGKPGLTDRIAASRQLMAKSFDVQSAVTGGEVDARKLAAAYRADAPFTGAIKDVAEWADSFGKKYAVPNADRSTVPGTQYTNAAAVTGGLAAMTAGAPMAGITMMGLPLSRGAVRDSMTTPEAQMEVIARMGKNRTTPSAEDIRGRLQRMILINQQNARP